MSNESSLKTLNQVLLQRSALRQTLEDHRTTTRDLLEREARLAEDEEKTKQAIDRAAGKACLDGKDASAETEKLRKKLAKIREERAPLRAAGAISVERQSEAESRAKEIEQAIANVGFAVASDVRQTSAAAVKDALDAIAQCLATMAAADGLVESLTATEPVLSVDVHPDEFSGAFVARKLLAGLTHFTRPDSLTDPNFKAAVARVANDLLAQATEGVAQ